MRKYLFIGCGGFIGAAIRYLIKSTELPGFFSGFPFATLFINIIGSFVFAFAVSRSFRAKKHGALLSLGLATGFSGAFTTFSAVCMENAGFISGGDVSKALLYSFISAGAGLFAVYLGICLSGGFGHASMRGEKP